MKAPLKSRRPTPDEALAIATTAAPSHPPAQIYPEPSVDAPTTFNLRLRISTVNAITAAAKERGLTMKQVMMQALAAAGVSVAQADLEDRTPRRR